MCVYIYIYIYVCVCVCVYVCVCVCVHKRNLALYNLQDWRIVKSNQPNNQPIPENKFL